MNLLLSSGEQHFPKFTYLGLASIPRFINSNCKDELWVLTFAGFLNLLSKSNIRSKVLTPFGMKFPFYSCGWCSSSSIMVPLNVSLFIKHSNIFWSSSNTLILVMLSGTKGLKSNSIEHLLFVGTNLAADVASKPAAAFFL